jgi:hypothetical protein
MNVTYGHDPINPIPGMGINLAWFGKGGLTS